MKKNMTRMVAVVSLMTFTASCNKGDDMPPAQSRTITIENVLDSKPLVESGSFKGSGIPPVILPGQSVSFSFYAAKNQRLTFATMYGWSNDLFFAPENPGIQLYDGSGNPVTGDVSAQIKLWDNGTRINQAPGAAVMHPGTAEASVKNVKEVNGMDDYGHTYLAASQLMQVVLNYEGNSKFTLTIKNSSGGTVNETPFSPGVWAVSYVAGGNLLLPEPVYSAGKLSMNGLTNIAEMGDITPLSNYLTQQTGIFTPLSPVLVVVYEGAVNPFYKVGESDRGEGLKELAQKGNADILAAALKTKPGVRNVYVLKDAANTVLLPKINGAMGGKVSQQLSLLPGDRIALATMYGFSNDWFFATTGNDIDGAQNGNVSASVGLFDNGTAISQYPGAGITQANLAGTPLAESKNIQAVPNPNAYNTLPSVAGIVEVTLQ
ncbi:spondin domain-containing protein [Niabella sp. CC-SYL272]|uniref:spondin domain-containing protein n=1 Tax=Niabella agricola TaxID=2891571 RepID=UPI001F38F76A|nr:spondin domain-containing protein [Niabella agricola]MCF3107738.1 spondin domain-containing protein [Niabella agricola]